ncbi:MAG: hypothetical protein R3D30_14625, partial [Hyphomicrobiales bacterium]
MRPVVLAAALALLAQPGASQESTEIPGHEGAAWMIAYEMHGGKFTPEQQNELVNLAWHLVVNN